MNITIIGCGVTTIAFLYNLCQLASADFNRKITVNVIEKSGCFGPGVAYSRDSESNILNTKAGYITPFYDKPGDFFNWLSANENVWRPHFKNWLIDADSYVSRSLFGMYLKHKMDDIINAGRLKRIFITCLNDEVKDITLNEDGYTLETHHYRFIRSDHVFMFCGTLTAKMPSVLKGSDCVFNTPYPIADLIQKINKFSSVGISGARLSCIDAVIGLIEGGHKGKISIHSRSGYFPSVRGTQGRISPKILTHENIKSLVAAKQGLKITDILRLIQEEMSILDGNKRVSDFSIPLPPSDLRKYLESEIALSDYPRSWQAVLYSTNAVIDELWEALNEECKREFFDKYMSAYICHRVSIPVENARKILSYLSSGQLDFYQGAYDLSAGTGDELMFVGHSNANWGKRKYDYIVQAIGSPRSIDALDSDLIKNMLKKKYIKKQKYGGIAVNTETYEVLNDVASDKFSIFAAGEITSGTFFFTSAVDIVSRHARNCAIEFCKRLILSRPASQYDYISSGRSYVFQRSTVRDAVRV
jgi:uncharacterized NAD(P)/FAD-binding protein YdhS